MTNPNFNSSILTVNGTQIIQALEEHRNVKLIFLVSPGNPTGRLVSLETVRAILSFHSKAEKWLVSLQTSLLIHRLRIR